jgi:long-chain fatty acid transport protein
VTLPRFGRASTLGAAAALLAAITASPSASAGGLFYSDRGVRPLGRAGAYVAGGDDLGSIAYNPAGMYDAGGQFFIDGSWVHFTSDYTRIANVQQTDPNTGKVVGTYQETFPTVSGTTPFVPIPTIVGSFRPRKDLVVAVGAWAPYAALTSYPSSVNGGPAPQRYSLLTLNGSLLAFVGAGVAWAPIKELRLGATVGMLTGVFKAQVALSGCVPERFICASEDPSWDVNAQMSVGPIFAPTGSLGAVWVPHPAWRVGAAFQLPVWIRSPATLSVQLPSTPVFEQASVSGNSADVAFDLPWTARLGVETRVVDNLRVELAGKVEGWSMQNSINLTPKGIALNNIAGFPATYYVPPISLPRGFQDSGSVNLGAEYHIPTTGNWAYDVRLGTSFETSAIPNGYLSVLTIDQNKVTLGLGGSIHYKNLRVDVVYAHVFGFNTYVNPANAKISLLSPVQANPPANPDYINGGNYSARADVLGLGLAYSFDPIETELPSR